MTNPINRETAEADFARFAEAMDVDTNVDRMGDDDDVASFNKQRDRLVAAIERGHLEINEAGEAVYTPQKSPHKDAIIFHERTGASIMASDVAKKHQLARKLYLVMADITKLPTKTFAMMVGTDVKVCEAITVFLMD